MAEIETKRSNEKKKGINKKSTRVDLTPMVDLGFLLLTFFVFTTALTTPKAMDLMMPNDEVITENDPVCESCVLTVLLDKDNRIKYYEGALENNPPVKETGFSPEQIRTVLMQKRAAVEKVRGSTDQFILIIKSSPASTFKNFVDMTDEVTICRIKKYYLDELSQADKNILSTK
jgi:biopolymer transport protein ExbD